MAENKKSFLVYCDLIHTVRKLSKEDAGELFLHLLEYTNDLNPVTENPIVDIVFEPIKQQLKRDLRSYEETKEERSINGRLGNLKRWNLDLFNKVESNELSIDEAENIAKHRKTSPPDSPLSLTIANIAVTDTDNVTVTDTVKEIKNNIDERKLKFASTLEVYLSQYGRDLLKDFYLYWTEPNKSNTKFRQELEKTWNLERRLNTWAKNDKNFNNNKKQNHEQLTNLTEQIRLNNPRV